VEGERGSRKITERLLESERMVVEKMREEAFDVVLSIV
jgi:hypothetical protein